MGISSAGKETDGLSAPGFKMLLIIDPEKCTGCRICEVYCSLSHEQVVNPDLSRIHIHGDQIRKVLVPVTCIPCDEKRCIAACPEPGAIHINEKGAVVIEESLCTACGKCVRACLIGAIALHRLPGRGKRGLAVALKCDQCGGDPWCVRVCEPQAITQSDATNGGQAIHDQVLQCLAQLPGASRKPAKPRSGGMA